MTRRRLVQSLVSAAIAVATLAYLYDPPWIAGMTTGFHRWEQFPSGARFRWTNGHASFFVPADAMMITIPMRAAFSGFDGAPVIALRVSFVGGGTDRRFRRVDVRVNRVRTEGNLGIQIGEVLVE